MDPAIGGPSGRTGMFFEITRKDRRFEHIALMLATSLKKLKLSHVTGATLKSLSGIGYANLSRGFKVRNVTEVFIIFHANS